MITYPGCPGPVVSDFLGREASRGHYAEGTTFQIARVRMVVDTGTYLERRSIALRTAPTSARSPLDRTRGPAGPRRGRDGKGRARGRVRHSPAASLRPRGPRPHRMGRALGHPPLLQRGIRTSRVARRSSWRPRGPRSSASTRSTSTTRATRPPGAHSPARRRGSRSWSISGSGAPSPSPARVFTPPAALSRRRSFPVRAYAVVP